MILLKISNLCRYMFVLFPNWGKQSIYCFFGQDFHFIYTHAATLVVFFSRRVRKVLNLRFFEGDTERRWAKSVKDLGLEILCLSQITLYHSLKGNKPDFHLAMQPEQSKAFYESFLEELRKNYRKDLVKGKLSPFAL